MEKHVRFLTLQKCQPLSVFLPLPKFFPCGEMVDIESVNNTFVLLLMNAEYVEAEVLARKYGPSNLNLSFVLGQIYNLIKQGLPSAACCAQVLARSFPEENKFAVELYESLISSTK
ncbi:MAG: hypothetical protein K6C34_04100 [Alphaproteobacteria bacterium]|nr:hypothetical protein [Alphaproteobacteria bacterium]